MALARLYQRVILDHNRTPRYFGRLAEATHLARGVDGLCGDDILVELRIVRDRIEAAMFSGSACAVSTASASMLMDWLQGRPRDEVLAAAVRFESLLADRCLADDSDLGEINCLRAVSEFPARVRNALLPWKTVVKALAAGD
jgi:nitrogen fixation NifU-like protein